MGNQLLLLLGLATVFLSACAVPLWEGWDEPFHYAYVEEISVHHQFPVLGKSTLSKEIEDTLKLTPLPIYLANSVPESVSFSEWHTLPAHVRACLRNRLGLLLPSSRYQSSRFLNYEAQQAPLAYVILSPLNQLLATRQIGERVVCLRLLEATVAILTLLFGLLRLASALNVEEPFRSAAILCCLCTQTLWVSLSHLGNDALAIPLTVWFCALLAGNKRLLMTAIVFSAGLLTKAYFLAFTPVFCIWLIVNRRGARTWLAALLPLMVAGPWYLRNLLLYGSISGTQESVYKHVSLLAVISAIPHIHWLQSVSIYWRSSIWAGSWSPIFFSKGLLYAEAILMLLGLGFSIKASGPAARWVWAALACFATGLAYQTCVTWVASGGTRPIAEAWYGQGVFACSWFLIFRSVKGWPRVYQATLIGLVTLSTTLALLTYPLVLLPNYAAGVKVDSALQWWMGKPIADLSLVLPVSPPIVISFLAIFSVLLLINFAFTISKLCATPASFILPEARLDRN